MHASPRVAQAPIQSRQRLRDCLLVVGFVMLCQLPFLSKPLHIDDPLFVWTARQIAAHPADFYGFDVNWGVALLPMPTVTQNPPLTAYWLAGVGKVLGFHEVSLHLGMLGMTAAAALGVYAVAGRLCHNPRFAALVACSTPAFLVSATTLMCDVMLVACWCWAVFFWLLAHERQRPRWLLVAAVLMAAAVLTKYFGIALVPLLGVYSLTLRPRRLLVYAASALVIPLAVLAGYEFLTREMYDRGLFSMAYRFADRGRDLIGGHGGLGLIDRLVSFVTYPGGCVLTLLFLLPWLGGRSWAIRGIVLWAGVLVAAIALSEPKPPPDSLTNYFLHVAIFSAAGVVLFALAIDDLRTRRDAASLLLALWIVGTAVFAEFVNWTTNVRSVLPLVPAAGIVAVRRIEQLAWPTGNKAHWLWAPLAGATAVSLLVAWADMTHARAERDAAARAIELKQAEGRRVWYSHHWGFHYYMQQGGLEPLDVRHDVAKAGDYYVLPQVKSEQLFPTSIVQPIAEMILPGPPLGSTMSNAAGAGFYSNSTGPLPYTLAPAGDFVYALYGFPNEIRFGRRPAKTDP